MWLVAVLWCYVVGCGHCEGCCLSSNLHSLLCPYKNSLSTDVGTKHTSYKKPFTHCYRPQRVQYFRLCMLHFGASLLPSFFSAPFKTGLLNYCMRRRNSIPEQIFLYVRCGKSTPGVMSRSNNSFKPSGRSSRTLY